MPQIFDFSHALLKGDLSAAEFSEACLQDLEALDETISNEQGIAVVSCGALVMH